MDVLGIGTLGKVGDPLAQALLRGDSSYGLVRRSKQRVGIGVQGVNVVVGNLDIMSAEALASAFGNVDGLMFSARTERNSLDVRRAFDAGAGNLIEATRRAGKRS